MTKNRTSVAVGAIRSLWPITRTTGAHFLAAAWRHSQLLERPAAANIMALCLVSVQAHPEAVWAALLTVCGLGGSVPFASLCPIREEHGRNGEVFFFFPPLGG